MQQFGEFGIFKSDFQGFTISNLTIEEHYFPKIKIVMPFNVSLQRKINVLLNS